jgi:uroporphyrin-III C-methyltransferase/precorrin-2 dehydrogenase/sirohydrochlorin ferrochelatase
MGESADVKRDNVQTFQRVNVTNVYPVTLINLQGARVVVVGGGRVAERKIRGLLAADARVTVVSPEATSQVRAWAEEGRLTWLRRPYQSGDLADARLAFAATDVRAVNALVAQDAAGQGVWCNVADVPAEGAFHVPAVYRGEGIVVAVSTAGQDPRRAQRIRDRIAAIPDISIGQKVPEEKNSGKAYLVGAGPGRPDLITVRGLRVLQQADVVLYDRLVASELLEEAPPYAERIFVGKEAGRHIMPQPEINALLIKQVRAGKRVVRLKGGDPFVLGRGGEEALALARAGLPFEVVPGVTSATAVPAYAGIPVTHRGVSTAFAVVTGHEAAGKPHSPTDWRALAAMPTLVILMAVKRIRSICDALLAAGKAPDTPTAVVSRGATSAQRVVRATVATLPDVLEQNPLPTPALVVVGEVAGLAEELAWFDPDQESTRWV